MKKKKFVKHLVLILLAALVFTTVLSGAFSVLAEAEVNNSTYESNNELLKAKYGDLLALKAENAGSPEGRNVNNYIDIYAKKMNSIDTAILYYPSAADIIDLYYSQGQVSGKLAWICYGYIEEFEDSAKAEIEKAHTALQDKLADVVTASEVNELALLSYKNGGLYSGMYEAVFRQKLLALLKEDDSDAVKAIVSGENGAIAEIAKCTDFTSSAQYDAIFDEASKNVSIQRNRDIASKEIVDIFTILFPEKNHAENSAVRTALEKINDGNTVLPSVMNSEVKTAADALLAEINTKNGKFLTEYFATLSADMSNSIAIANSKSEIADLSSLFEKFSINFARAEAKDMIAADIEAREYKNDTQMTDLANSYNKNGGIIDSCLSEKQIAFEVACAKKRADLYGEYLNTIKTIDKWVDSKELKEEAKNQYSYADYLITKLLHDDEDAEKNLQTEYDKGCEKLAELVVKAEIQAYEPKHKPILDKKKDEVTPEDKEAILAAITDLGTLSDASQAAFEDKKLPDDLAEKYKAVTEQEIEALVGDSTDDRKNYLYKLKDKLDDIKVTGKADDLPEVVEKTDVVLAKAEAIDCIFDRYEKITSEPQYENFSDSDKNAIKEIAKNNTEEVFSAAVSAEEIAKLAEEAVAKLDRAEAIAKVNLAASSRTDKTTATKKAVSAIVEKAKVDLGGKTSYADITSIADRAIFDIKQEFDIQDMTAKAEGIISEINKLDALTDEQKTEFEKKIRDALEGDTALIRDISDETAHKQAVEAFNSKADTMLQSAIKTNDTERTNRREKAKADLKSSHQALTDKLDGLLYLTSEERKVYKDEADKALAGGLEKLSEAVSVAEITSAKNNTEHNFNNISEKGKAQNKNAGIVVKTNSTAELRSKAEALIMKINNAEYLGREEINVLKKDVDTALASALENIEKAEGIDELNGKKQAALDDFEALGKDCDKKNLEGAKKSAILELKQAREEVDKKVSGFWFISYGEEAALAQKTSALYLDGEGRINSCQSVPEVMSAKDTALGQLASHREEAIDKENQACVNALSPFIIGFGIALLVEAIIFAVAYMILNKRSRQCYAMSLIPLPIVALAISMPTPVAWLLTIALALADIALGVLIIQTIIKICKLPKPEKKEELEEADEIDEADDEMPLLEGNAEAEEEGGSDTMPVPKLSEKPQANQPRLKAKPKLLQLFAPPARLKLEPKPQLVYLLPPTVPEIVGLITAKEADMLISDEDAFNYEETNIVNTEVYTGKKKAAVNIYTISQSFEVGDLVSINTLKEKGLISQNVGYVKILGKGYLDKPLTVVAQNFSASAVKMIVLTGGQAILAEGSPERRKKKKEKK